MTENKTEKATIQTKRREIRQGRVWMQRDRGEEARVLVCFLEQLEGGALGNAEHEWDRLG